MSVHVMPLPMNGQKPLLKVPLVSGLGASTLQLLRVVLPQLPTPLPDGFMGHGDTALEPQLLPVAIAQGEPIIQPGPWLMISPGKRWFLSRSVLAGGVTPGCLSWGSFDQ